MSFRMTLACVALAANAALAAEKYGGIEIGSKGVKAVVVELAGDPPAPKEVWSSDGTSTIIAGAVKAKGFNPEAVADTIELVKKSRDQLKSQGVPADRIVLAASSGVAAAGNVAQLLAKIRTETGLAGEAISGAREGSLGFLGAVPTVDQGDALYIDVGSGNTKGGALDGSPPAVESRISTFVVPFGTVSFTDFVKSKSAGGDFVAKAEELRKTAVTDPLANWIAAKKAARTKVYLGGGASWALATLVHPGRVAEGYPQLKAADFAAFAALVKRNPKVFPAVDLGGIDDPATRAAAEKEIRKVQERFTPANLVAAAQLLLAVADSIDAPHREIHFVRNSHLSWIVALVKSRIPSPPVGVAAATPKPVETPVGSAPSIAAPPAPTPPAPAPVSSAGNAAQTSDEEYNRRVAVFNGAMPTRRVRSGAAATKPTGQEPLPTYPSYVFPAYPVYPAPSAFYYPVIFSPAPWGAWGTPPYYTPYFPPPGVLPR